jgi:hypothetical protein
MIYRHATDERDRTIAEAVGRQITTALAPPTGTEGHKGQYRRTGESLDGGA